MDDLLKKYGGIANLKKNLLIFIEKIGNDKGIKHYLFGVKTDHVLSDQVNFRSFVMRKLDHHYGDAPVQTALPSVRVKLNVTDDVMKVLQNQLRVMGVNWREVPRMAHHILTVIEETRARASDTVKSSLESNIVNTQAIDDLLKKKGAQTKLLPTGDLLASSGLGIAYPTFIRVDPIAKKITLTGKGYFYQSVSPSEIQTFVDILKKRWAFMEFSIKQDEEGSFVETSHIVDYSGGSIPMRMFIELIKEFSWRFDEVMSQDKNDILINLVADKKE